MEHSILGILLSIIIREIISIELNILLNEEEREKPDCSLKPGTVLNIL